MNNVHERTLKDAAGHNNEAVCEKAVILGGPGNPPTNADQELDSRAADFHGGRVRATIQELTGVYSVEFWFYNTLLHTARPVTAYLFSRGVDGPEGTPSDVERGYPDGVKQLFVGGRNDNFANFQGKIADVSVYDRALTHDEAVRHYEAAGLDSRPLR
jgi:hypothetical protein